MAKLANIMIGLVLFSMIITGIVTYISGFEEHYDITMDEGWGDVYNISQNITTMGKEMQDVLENPEGNWAVGGVKLGMSVLRTVLKLPILTNKLINEVFARFHICEIDGSPSCWIRSGIKTIVALSIIFLIVQALVRWYL